ncbi:MAG: TIGR01212 family radical SAM protein [Firmicutes bacterium]|nr:TIGR01212 family radical SAM protein [Bacillota bacterium]
MPPIIFDSSDGQDLRINMISPWLKKRFGCKVIKLALDGGFTCPNRDGSKGYGGCLFCSESGSGDMASSLRNGSDAGAVSEALSDQISLLSRKWPEAKYLAYFQSHTNTYAPVSELREKFEPALKHPDVLGIIIATRPDCLPDDVIDYLAELNGKTFLWVELGLQTTHDETARAMNLCHNLADYDDAVARLTARGIRVVTHLILGLPGETREMMEQSVRYVCGGSSDESEIFGLKLHMLNVVKGSGLCETMPDYVPFDSIEEYVDLLIDMIEIIPSNITIHRISGDAPRSTLVAPEWSYKKRTILNMIHNQMRLQNTWQGKSL